MYTFGFINIEVRKLSNIDFLEIGERIKKQRLMLGYSRETLAEMVDITPRFCYDLELGLKKMSLKTLCRLSEALCLSTDYILFGDKKDEDEFSSIVGIIKTCPNNKRKHLEQIVSHYIQAVQEEDN